jgi:glycosyltransferase involved in cell wall biosynthesis
MRFPLYIREIYNLVRLFQENNISVVHCHGFRADVIGGVCARLCGLPAVSSVHGWIAYSNKMRFYKWLDIKALRLFAVILPVSKKLEQELLENGISLKRVQLLRNIPANQVYAIPNHGLAPRNGSVQIGFIGRLSNEKGLGFLIGAVNKLRMDHSIHLHIVGDGPEKSEILSKIKLLGLEELVTFHGVVPNPQTIYPMLDLLVLPSLTEGIPLTLLEGMSFGLPIVASNVGGIPEIIENGNNGVLVEPGSSDELAAKIAMLIKERDLRSKLGTNAKQTISTLCDREKWKQTLEKVYELCGGRV